MQAIRVVLADRQTLFREGLKALFNASESIAVVGELLRPEDAATTLQSTAPDLLLMDAGTIASQMVRSLHPRTRAAFLTSRQDETALSEYQESGAAGYVLKDACFRELLSAIRTIHAGGTWISGAVSDRMSTAGPRLCKPSLTAREQEVLKMTAEGCSVKEVAAILDLSVKTVDAHKVNLMRKLRIHNKAQLVHYAFQNRILKLSSHAHS